MCRFGNGTECLLNALGDSYVGSDEISERDRSILPTTALGLCRAAEPRGRGTAVPRSQSTMAAYWHFVIMVVGGIETMWLSHCHTRGLLKWEPIWWVAIA